MGRVDLSTYGGPLLDEGYAGQVVDLNTHSAAEYLCEEKAGVDFGLFLVRGTAGHKAKLPSAAADKVVGVSIRHVTMVADPAGEVAYREHMPMPALELGRIRVFCEDGCNPGDPVHVRYAGDGVRGAARSAAVTDQTLPVLTATWVTKTAAGALGVVRIVQ